MLVLLVIKKNIGFIVFLVIVIFLITVYRIFDPIASDFFPKCPFLVFTGYQCPGCGSQRAVHELLNLNIMGAWRQNALFLISMPYVLTGLIFNYLLKPSSRVLYWRKLLFGQRAIFLVLIVIVCFWIVRNF